MHICSGINSIPDLGDVDFELVRLAYEVIWRAILVENSPLVQLIQSALERQKRLLTETDLDLRLRRIQGALWAYLALNEEFHQLLKEGVCSVLSNYTYQWEDCNELKD